MYFNSSDRESQEHRGQRRFTSLLHRGANPNRTGHRRPLRQTTPLRISEQEFQHHKTEDQETQQIVRTENTGVPETQGNTIGRG